MQAIQTDVIRDKEILQKIDEVVYDIDQALCISIGKKSLTPADQRDYDIWRKKLNIELTEKLEGLFLPRLHTTFNGRTPRCGNSE